MANSYAFVLSKNTYPDAWQANFLGVHQGTRIVYAETNTLNSSTVLYADSRLTQPIYGNPDLWLGVQLLTDTAVKYAVEIAESGAINPVSNPTTTTTAAPTTTTTAAPTTTTTAAPTTTTTAAPTTTTTTTTAAPIDCIVDVYNITDGVCTTLLASNYNITTSTPVIVGKWYTPSSLIAYNIISLGGSGGAFEVLTNERDTCNTFSGDVFWSDISCSDSAGLIQVTGNGTTFCDSTVLTSSSFEGFSVGSHFITTAMSGQTYTVSTNGSIFATVTSACTAC